MNKQDTFTGLEIAVIGMAGRFPGADDIETLWSNLQQGIDAVMFFSDEELSEAGIHEDTLNNPAYIKAKQGITGKGYFDSAFFGYTPGEARIMDPQIRIFHECAWTALEDAGYNPDEYPGLIGLYAGSAPNFNWEAFTLLSQAQGGSGSKVTDDFTAMQLRNRDFLTTRISHKLNLKGPAVFMQTACSTSLVAVHMACRGLLMGDCTIALAGGITITNTIKSGYFYQEGMISSPDGHCRAFDARAQGTVSGEGAAIVVLKKLKKAREHGDNIYAVIKGTAINNDGIRRVGFSAPSVDGQADVIRMAHKLSRVPARSISYIEAHGTGTRLGDPIEIEALVQVFGNSQEKYCAVGSIKSNLGHMDAAAGAAGLIKTALALKHRLIPPCLHFQELNDKIDLQHTPFYINTRLKEWKNHNYPLRAGVSSFGIGGTNAHVVLEEAPPVGSSRSCQEYHLLLFSAGTKPALQRITAKFTGFLKKCPSQPQEQDNRLADIAYTLQLGRKAFSHRSMLVCKDISQAIDILSSPAGEEIKTFTAGKEKKNIVFMFPGQGSQYVDMGRQLYRKESLVREEMDRCFEILKGIPDEDIKEILYPGNSISEMSEVSETNEVGEVSQVNNISGARRRGIHQTEISQLVLFIIEYALAKLLIKWGITPGIMIGHSIGEYTAACLSGVLSLENALELVMLRGRLMQGLPIGTMLSIPLSEKEIEPLLQKYNREQETISIAAVNSPQSCVVSGSEQAAAALEKEIQSIGITTQRLHTSHAFHSAMMDPVLERFQKTVENIPLEKPRIPYISNVTGKVIRAEEATDPAYWRKHIRSTVLFSRGVESLLKKANALFIEVGPGKSLSTLIRQQAPAGSKPKTINLLRHPREQVDDQAYLLSKIGELWLYGFSPDWNAFYENQRRRRVSFPTYSFDKTRYPVGADLEKLLALLAANAPAMDFETEEESSQEAGTGLIDRPSDLTTPYIAPNTPTEKKLIAMWEMFFGIEKIGIKDDFFQLGGDSLKAMSLVAQIHQQLAVELPMVDFFAHSNIKTLAQHIDSSVKKVFSFIPPVEEKEYYVVSSQQKRLYFQQHLDPDSAAYNLLQPIPMEGEIDMEMLESAFKLLIIRHESLRTSFHFIDGNPVQKIHSPDESEFTGTLFRQINDIREISPKEEVSHLFCPFDLSRPPLLRLGLIKEEKRKHILILEIHHIISDGISLAILSREMIQLYSRTIPPGLEPAELKIRCRDYAQWQQSWYDSAEFKNQEAYWLKQFEDVVPLTNLPTDYPYPILAPNTRETGSVIFTLDSRNLEKIKRWTVNEGVTLFFILMAVYYTLLSRYSGQEDIVVGTGSADRNYTDLEPIIGLFIQVLAMRNRPQKEKTFSLFLNEVKQHALDAFANQEYPFENLVKALNLQGNSPVNPVFNVAFELLNMDFPGAENPGESYKEKDNRKNIEENNSQPTTTGNHQGLQTAHYDLTLYCTQTPDSVEITLVYDAGLFKHSTAETMAEHYIEILNQVLENKEIKLKDILIPGLEILSEEEKNRLLLEFNRDSARDVFPPGYQGDQLIQQLFEEQVEKTPDAPALVYRHCTLTYRELNKQANILAHILRARGVGADTLTAIMMEPSIETTIGILGTLKSGGAYLPIHHETPAERLFSLLKDSRVNLVITKNNILRRQSFTVLQGLRRQEMKPFKTKPRQHITDFDSLPFPDRSLVNYEAYNKYIGHNLIHDCISLQATRGCPFNCAYCHKIWPKTHVTRSAENIFAEVLFNYNLGIRRFSFVDDILNFDRKNSRRFFELIVQHQLDLYLFFLMRGDMLSKEYIDLMIEAGLVRLGLALETASPRLQKLVGKHLNIEKLRTNLEYIAEKYPHVILELYTMHGFPSETKEEAMMTLDFIKGIKWLHFPYIFVLTIYPNTEMEKLALDNGIPPEAIDRSLNLGYHELPDTLPFEKDFSIKYQAEFLNDYFLAKERLVHVLPQQMKILTEAEMVQKYNSYLPVEIKSFKDLLTFFNLRREELTTKQCMDQKQVFVPQLNAKYKAAYPSTKPADNALRLLLLDLSQNFSSVHGRLDEMIEPPLGLMYLLTYLNRQFKEKINGKIAKAMIDFDSFAELKVLLDTFQPQVIGVRTLSLYKDFFHETIQKIRHWGFTAPILTGGPYATSSFHTLLQDTNIDLVVLGEGETTLSELLKKIMANDGKLPTENELEQIAGIVFIPEKEKKSGTEAREIISVDDMIDVDSRWLQNPKPVNRTHHLAYNIFTSGSMGLPKGVMVEHRNVSRLVYGLKEKIYKQYAQSLNIALVAPYVFDASVKQIFAALLLGHKLHMIPENTRIDGPGLLRFYKKYCIDLSDGTPTLIRMILETINQLESQKDLSLKHLIIGGEPLPKDKVQELFARSCENNLIITNVYGPTEGTVDNTSFEVTLKTLRHYKEIPIGKPMPFDCIIILNKENKPVPIGVPGELYIGGGKISRGYLNNPQLTREKFNQKFMQEVPGLSRSGFREKSPIARRKQKIYKTGDLVRCLEDGNIEFIGRIDRQVKIRGIRIEPEEIESRLAALTEIKQAVVTTRADNQGYDCLCAYIVTKTDIDLSQLRRILTLVLPNYMIPAYIIKLPGLPLTPGGKINRKALPHTAEVGSDIGDRQFAAPRNSIEKQLVEIIGQVLGRKHIGIYENIFNIGGDSIKTIQIAYGMKNAGYNLEIKDIFEFPTVAALAPRANKIEREADQSVITGKVPLSPVQEEFFNIYTIAPHHFNQAFMFYSKEPMDTNALETMVMKLREHHDALRMTYKRGEKNRIIQWNHGLEYPYWFRVYDFRNRQDTPEALETECNRIQASIDLEKGPLMKVALFRTNDGDRLLVVIHHLVVDGMSWRILFEDISILYNHYREPSLAEPPQLPPKSDSFKLWSEGVREYADSPGFLAEKDYWAQGESSPVQPIKRDFPEEITCIKDLDNLSFSLSEAETDRLFTRINPVLETEINDILLTGLGAAFKKVFAQDRLVVALEGHGRQRILKDIDVGRTLGWFTGIYPVVLDFSDEMTLSARIREVKERLRQVPNKGIGYGILKYITSDENKKEIRFKLEPQVVFNYLGQFDTDVGKLSFEIARESPGHTHSLQGIRKYDFTVTGIAAARQLMISILYSKKQYKPETVEAILFHFRETLNNIIIQECSED